MVESTSGTTGEEIEEGVTSTGAAWGRLQDQLGWYELNSTRAQMAYKGVKVAQLIIGAAVPVFALTDVWPIGTAALGAIVIVLEGLQQLYQWQTNWVLYRSTAEALKHEKYLFLVSAGPYATSERNLVLAERVEGLVSQEHAKWTQERNHRANTGDSK